MLHDVIDYNVTTDVWWWQSIETGSGLSLTFEAIREIEKVCSILGNTVLLVTNYKDAIYFMASHVHCIHSYKFKIIITV